MRKPYLSPVVRILFKFLTVAIQRTTGARDRLDDPDLRGVALYKADKGMVTPPQIEDNVDLQERVIWYITDSPITYGAGHFLIIYRASCCRPGDPEKDVWIIVWLLKLTLQPLLLHHLVSPDIVPVITPDYNAVRSGPLGNEALIGFVGVEVRIHRDPEL